MKALEILSAPTLPQVILDKAQQVPSEPAKKIDHIANMINAINTEAKKIKAQEAVLASGRKQLESLVERAEASLKEEMTAEGICELQGEMIKYTVGPSPHRLIIDDESAIPAEYKHEVVTVEIRKDAIKDELKLGSVIPGTRLEQGITLKLQANKG